MRIFKNAWFERFARKQHIPDETLLEAIKRAEKGQIDADLGSGVIKQRIARKGQGKSGGFRTIILYRSAKRAFFVYGFAKNACDNIEDDEELHFKRVAAYVFGLSDKQLADLIGKGQFLEVHKNDQKIPK